MYSTPSCAPVAAREMSPSSLRGMPPYSPALLTASVAQLLDEGKIDTDQHGRRLASRNALLYRMAIEHLKCAACRAASHCQQGRWFKRAYLITSIQTPRGCTVTHASVIVATSGPRFDPRAVPADVRSTWVPSVRLIPLSRAAKGAERA